MNCDDFLKFTNFQRVAGGAQKRQRSSRKRLYVGITARRYAVQSPVCQVAVKVPMTDGAMPCMTLPKKMPNDIDYGWYEREAA